MDLITADYFAQQTTTLGLKSSFTPPADALATLIAEASEWVVGYCRRLFGAQTVIESVRGKDRRRLILDQWPVATITTIAWVDDDGNSGTVTTSDIRILTGGILEWKLGTGVWYSSYLYTVTYTLPDPVPGPVKRATALKVVDLLDPQYFPGKTKDVELISNVQEQIVTLLDDHRRERLG